MDILDLIGETTVYDKKRELERKNPLSWLKSVSAFANTNGGVLVYGVADDSTATGFFAILPNLNKGFSMTVSGGKTTTETTTETTTASTTATTTATGQFSGELHEEKTVSDLLGRVGAKIYRMVSSDGRLTACEIARKVRISENGVRYHLKKIKAAGLARYIGNSQKDGHWECIEG